MRYVTMCVVLIAGGFLLGCSSREDSKPSLSETAEPTNSTRSKKNMPDKGPAVDTKGLPNEGPADPALTYDVVKENTAKHKGKRVTWPFKALGSLDNERMLCALNEEYRTGPQHYGLYVVEFASNKELGRAFMDGALGGGGTITGTVAREVEVSATILEKDQIKVTVPLLLVPTYPAGGEGKRIN